MVLLSTSVAIYDHASDVSPPVTIGEYFVDREKEIFPGRDRARHLRELSSPVFFDLNKGFYNFDPREGHQGLGSLQSWAQLQAGNGKKTLKEVFHNADIVSRRGLLTDIGETPYALMKMWRIAARLEGGIIFLHDLVPDPPLNSDEKLWSYWGYKFEQYMTTEEPGGEPDTSSPISCVEQFVTIAKSEFGLSSGERLRVVCAGEVDAIDKDGSLVEMKTQKLDLEYAAQSHLLRFPIDRDLHRLGWKFWRWKALHAWQQSYLVGAKTLVIGLKDPDGFVKEVVTVPVYEVERSGKKAWQSRVCLNFIATVLGEIKAFLSGGPRTLCIKYNPNDGLVHFYQATKEEADFLSPAFLQHFKLKEEEKKKALLSVLPSIANFRAAGGVSTHRFVNTGATRLVFKLMTTNNLDYRYEPYVGFVEPLGTTSLKVTRLIGPPKEDKIYIHFGEAPFRASDAKEAFKTATPAGAVLLPLVAH